MNALLAWEGNVLLWIQDNFRNDVLNPIMKVITHLGYKGAFWIALTLVLLIFRKTRKAGICCAMALLIMIVCNNLIIKNLVNRTRPYDVFEELEILVAEPDDSSFPSGHTAAAFATSVALTLSLPLVMDRKKARRFGTAALALSFLIGFSRLYVGVHYPTDVLGGTILGILYGLAGYYIGIWAISQLRGRWPSLFEPAEPDEPV